MIANYLPSQELRSCRLVCKLWSVEMDRVLSKRQQLIITDPKSSEAEGVLRDYKLGRSTGAGTLCFFDISPNSSLFKRLLCKFGWTLSSLKLEECKLKPLDLKNILLHAAPHLESFSLKDRIPETQVDSTFSIINTLSENKFVLPLLKKLQWSEEFGRVQLQEIIKCCPNLVDLEYKHCPIPGEIKHFRSAKWDSLKSLKLSPRDELRGVHLSSLAALNLKLKRLTLFGLFPKNKARMLKLHDFLKSLSSTLVELELYQHYTLTYQTYSDCKLAKDFLLTTMVLVRSLRMDFAFIKSLKFVNKFPSLQHFVCRSQGTRDWRTVLAGGSSPRKSSRTYPTLKSMNVGEICHHSLNRLSNYFSSIVDLEMDAVGLDDRALRIIISGFPLLQELKIIQKSTFRDIMKLTDSGITGIPTEICENIVKNKNYEAIDAEKVREYPQIADLKRKLQFKRN